MSVAMSCVFLNADRFSGVWGKKIAFKMVRCGPLDFGFVGMDYKRCDRSAWILARLFSMCPLAAVASSNFMGKQKTYRQINSSEFILLASLDCH